jgi:hypothetical protein
MYEKDEFENIHWLIDRFHGTKQYIVFNNATTDELERIKKFPDNDLLRASTSMDIVAVVESSRRLREALQKEEKVIKNLTATLVVFTIILMYFTMLLIFLEYMNFTVKIIMVVFSIILAILFSWKIFNKDGE